MGGTLKAIIEHRADITLGEPPPVSPMQSIQFESIMIAQWLFVVAKDHPLVTAPQPLTEQDTQPYVSIVIRDSATQSPIRPHRSLGERPILRVASMEQNIQAQLQGLGVGFLPKHKIDHLLDSGELVAREIERETS